ncbi:MAG: sodium/proton-translocating pyrophosphatase [Polyangiaceae bacterium]|nr:sodium/proton-translocating pyrophosphatase [Polyangiaceae bacterium]
MTQFGLILAIETSGLVFAVLLARWLLRHDSGGGEVRRLGGAIGRAIDAFLREEGRAIALLAGGLAAVSFGAHAALTPSEGVLSRIEVAFWAALALGLGAASTALVARIATKTALASALRVLHAARDNTDRALAIAIRSGGVLGLLTEAASVIALGLPMTLLLAMKGGFGSPSPELTAAVMSLAPGFALGSVVAALVVQRAGAIFHSGSDVAADLGGERGAGLPHDDAQNPVVVADLVGDHVGHAAARAVSAFVSACLGNVAAALIAVALVEASATDPRLAPLAFLPLVVRALGLLACGVGIMVVRTEEARDVSAALWRGQATASAILLGGLVGAASWLLGESAANFVWAGVAGLLAVSVVAHATRARLDKRLLPLREVVEALKFGDATTLVHGLGAGLGASWLPMLVLGTALVAAHQLGLSSGLAHGSVVAPIVALTTALAVTPFMVALGSFGPMADAARGIASMTPGAGTADGQRRTARLDDAGFFARAVSQSHLSCVAAWSAMLAAAAAVQVRAGATVDLMHPAVLWCGGLGLGLGLAYAASGAHGGARSAQSLLAEVKLQLRAFPRERGKLRLPAEFTPSYKACIELASRAGFRHLIAAVLVVLAAPVGLTIALWLTYRHDAPALVSQALTAFVLIAAITGLGMALALDAARMTLSAARRVHRQTPDGAELEAALTGDAVADIIGTASAPALLLSIQAATAAILVTTSFLLS